MPLNHFLDARIRYPVRDVRARDVLPGLMEVIKRHVECARYREARHEQERRRDSSLAEPRGE